MKLTEHQKGIEDVETILGWATILWAIYLFL